MSYRQFDTNTWQDPWFESLSPKAKLLFIYLWTNGICNQAGMYQISQKRIEFELGFKIDNVIEELTEKVLWDKKRNIVWVKNFFRWQCQNKSFAIAALNAIASLPPDLVAKFITYNKHLIEKFGVDLSEYNFTAVPTPCDQGGDTVSTPCHDGDNTHPSSVTVTETVTENNNISSSQPDGCDQQSESESSKRKNKKAFSEDSKEYQLAKLLLDCILEHRPNLKKPDLQSWAKHIDLMLRVDQRTPEEMEQVIRWCQKDPFWQANILSTRKLREKFDQLALKMEQTRIRDPSLDDSPEAIAERIRKMRLEREKREGGDKK